MFRNPRTVIDQRQFRHKRNFAKRQDALLCPLYNFYILIKLDKLFRLEILRIFCCKFCIVFQVVIFLNLEFLCILFQDAKRYSSTQNSQSQPYFIIIYFYKIKAPSHNKKGRS